MPGRRHFVVRRYECDPYGHLNNANYLRFLVETAQDTPPPGVLRRVRLEFLRPCGPGDDVAVVETGATSDGFTRRHYRFLLGEIPVATGEAEWVTDHDRGDPVPPPPDRPRECFRIVRPVEWRDVGPHGRAHTGTLAALAEEAGIRVAAAYGWPMTRCSAAGFAIVLRRSELEIGDALGLDDEVRIETWVSDPRRSMATRHYLLERRADGEPVARFRTLYVWVDLETGRPVRIPEAFLESFAPNFST